MFFNIYFLQIFNIEGEMKHFIALKMYVIVVYRYGSFVILIQSKFFPNATSNPYPKPLTQHIT